MELKTKVMLICILTYFTVLYIVAFIANKNSREDDDILWVSRSQWKAILVMWLPSLIVLVKE